MKTVRWLFVCVVIVTSVKPPTAICQAQTNVPAAIPGAKPAGVEHIKIQRATLEGNLEENAVDRAQLFPFGLSAASFMRNRRAPLQMPSALRGETTERGRELSLRKSR